MSQDPASVFGNLVMRCISETYKEKSKALTEGVVVAVLGFLSSVATTYLLGLAGVL